MDPEIRTAQRNGRDLFCPKCKEALLVALQDETEVDYCRNCKGIWVDYVEEKTLLNMKPEVFTMDELRRLRKHYQSFSKRDPVR